MSSKQSSSSSGCQEDTTPKNNKSDLKQQIYSPQNILKLKQLKSQQTSHENM